MKTINTVFNNTYQNSLSKLFKNITMKTDFIKNLDERQLILCGLTLGVFFNKSCSMRDCYNTPKDSAWFAIHKEGLKELKDYGVDFSQVDFTVKQVIDLIKVEMFKKGIESI